MSETGHEARCARGGGGNPGRAGAGSPERAALTLAAIATRSVAELNKLARARSIERRGTPAWGSWAGLANSARDAVLRVATCRKAATELAKEAAQERHSPEGD